MYATRDTFFFFNSLRIDFYDWKISRYFCTRLYIRTRRPIRSAAAFVKRSIRAINDPSSRTETAFRIFLQIYTHGFIKDLISKLFIIKDDDDFKVRREPAAVRTYSIVIHCLLYFFLGTAVAVPFLFRFQLGHRGKQQTVQLQKNFKLHIDLVSISLYGQMLRIKIHRISVVNSFVNHNKLSSARF